MAEYTSLDVILDFDGNESSARAHLMKRGFALTPIAGVDIIPIEKQKEYFEKNEISYVELLNSEGGPYLFTENLDILQSWIKRVKGANEVYKTLNDTAILKSAYYKSLTKAPVLCKNAQQKIRKKHISTCPSVNIDCSAGHVLPYSSISPLNSIFKLIKDILESYIRNGWTIESTHDFKKLIGISDNYEYLTVKFFDDAQAAEFIVYYGDVLKK
jgi:hypothetical protein